VYVYKFLCIYTYVCISIHICKRAHIYMQLYIYVYAVCLLDRIGFIESEHILPFTGYDSFTIGFDKYIHINHEIHHPVYKNV
jgi:hypothetical protein